MASNSGGDPPHSRPANVECEDCDLKMPPSPDNGKAGSTGGEQPDESIDKLFGKNIHPPVNGDVEDGGSGDGHIGIPPWTITLVPLIGPTEMESVEIPQDVNLHVTCIAPEVKYVRLAIVVLVEYKSVVTNNLNVVSLSLQNLVV